MKGDPASKVEAPPTNEAPGDIKMEKATQETLRKCIVEDETAGPMEAPPPLVPLAELPRQMAAKHRGRSMSSSSSSSGNYYTVSSKRSKSPPEAPQAPPSKRQVVDLADAISPSSLVGDERALAGAAASSRKMAWCESDAIAPERPPMQSYLDPYMIYFGQVVQHLEFDLQKFV